MAGAVEGATTIETSAGPVEHAVLGEGTPVLVAHGSPGGIDQAEAMARFLVAGGCQAIVLSRPGYLGTPLGERRTIDQQADLLAALLDALGIERAGVLSWSGGGPCGYRLAVRHPERVRAIVALAAVGKAYPRPHEDLTERLLFTTRPGNALLRFLGAHAPEQLISATLASESDLTREQVTQRAAEVFADEGKRRFVIDLAESVARIGREDGYENDLDQFAAIEDLELERIAAPTLLVQGSADNDVAPGYSADAAARIPGADLLTLDTGTHLAFYTHPESAQAQARALALLKG